MRALIGTAGRLLAAHWPALLAWYLVGTLGRYVGLQVAGFVGGYTAIGGILLLPLAILAKLVSVVAMFLVLRDGMSRLSAVAPLPPTPRARREAFRDALLSAILPFMAVYAALGFLVEDVASYLDTALEVKLGRELTAAVGGVTVDTSGTVDRLSWEPWTIAVVVLAIAGRWAWKRWSGVLPRWTAIGATYLEGLWVFLTVYFVGEALGQVAAWVDSRQAIAWVGDAREWIGGVFAPLGWAWDAVLWVIGEAGAVMLLPLAWLTIAGVVYGQAIAPQGVRWRGRLVTRSSALYGSVPERVRRRLTDLGAGVGSRFRPMWNAIVLMWRSGPILIGGYVLVFTLLLLLEGWLRIGLTRLVGPHDLDDFWIVFYVPLMLVVPLIVEPLRTIVIAAAYDATVGALLGRPSVPTGHEAAGEVPGDAASPTSRAAGGSGLDDQAQEPRQGFADGDVDSERAGRIGGDDVGDLQREGRGSL